jgi:hypothetical protein
VAAVEAGGFAAAGERLHLTRSAVAKAIARIEERLNVRLFHRTTRSLGLRTDGVIAYPCLAVWTVRNPRTLSSLCNVTMVGMSGREFDQGIGHLGPPRCSQAKPEGSQIGQISQISASTSEFFSWPYNKM